MTCIPKSRWPHPAALSPVGGGRGCSSELEPLGQLPWSLQSGSLCSSLSSRRLAPPPAEACLDLFLQVRVCVVVGGWGGVGEKGGKMALRRTGMLEKITLRGSIQSGAPAVVAAELREGVQLAPSQGPVPRPAELPPAVGQLACSSGGAEMETLAEAEGKGSGLGHILHSPHPVPDHLPQVGDPLSLSS